MGAGFVKIYASITRSSVWLESATTRLVWITMLVEAGPDGIVDASCGGLAHAARVTKAECRAALDVLEAPDLDSRSPEHDGRRIEKVDGGWLVLNHAKYRERQSERNVKAAERQRRYRERRADEALLVTDVTPSSHQKQSSEAEAEAEAEAESSPAPTHSHTHEQIELVAPHGAESEQDDDGNRHRSGSPGDPAGADSALCERPGPDEAGQPSANTRDSSSTASMPGASRGAGTGGLRDAGERSSAGGRSRSVESSPGTRGSGRPDTRRGEPSPDAIAAAQYLYDAIKSHDDGYRSGARNEAIVRSLNGWAKDIDVGMRNDGMTLDGCKLAIDTAHRSDDHFWRSNLLSGAKLRKHYEKLRIRGASNTATSGPTTGGYGLDYDAIGERLDKL